MIHKTIILFFLLVIFATNLNAQSVSRSQFLLNCEISSSAPAFDSIILRYSDEKGEIKTLSKSYNAGKVKFAGTIAFPRIAAIAGKFTTEGKEVRIGEFFLSPNEMLLKAQTGPVTKLKISGSKTNDEFAEIVSLQKPYRASLDSLYKAKSSTAIDGKVLIDNEILLYETKFAKVTERFIQAHPKSFTSIQLIYELLDIVPKSNVLMLFNSLSDEVKNTWMGKVAFKRINQNEETPTLLGLEAPNFKSETIKKAQINLKDFRGKIVLLDFWASWCKPCRVNTPLLLELYNEYKGAGFQIIGIADDDNNHIAWEKAIKSEGTAEWHHILRGYIKYKNKNPNDIHKNFNIPYLPTYILIDKEGIVAGIYSGEPQDLEALKGKLKTLVHNIQDS